MLRSYWKRRCPDLFFLLLTAIFFAGCSTVGGPRGDTEEATPWSTLYYNTARHAAGPDTLEPPFGRVWAHDIGPFEKFKLYPPEQMSVPVLMDGVLYVGSTNERFYAYDYASGRRLWRFDAGYPVESTATVTGTAVCFGTSDGILNCLDRETGDLLWSFSTGSEIISSPVVTNNTVYFYSSTDQLFALDLVSGREIWSHRHSYFSMVAPRVRTSPAVTHDGEKIFQVFSDGTLMCFEAITGKILWEKKVYRPDISAPAFRVTPAVLGDTIYLIGDGLKAQARLVEDGRLIKTYDEAEARDFVLLDRNRILVVSGTGLALLDTRTGDALWKKELGGSKSALAGVSVSGGTVLVLQNTEKRRLNLDILTSRRGHIIALSLESGRILWQKKLRSTLTGGVAASGGGFALLTDRGDIEVWAR